MKEIGSSDDTERSRPAGDGTTQRCGMAATFALEARIVGADGTPAANVTIALSHAADGSVEAVSSRLGIVRFEGLLEETCSLTLPLVHHDTWSLIDDAPLALPQTPSAPPATWRAAYNVPCDSTHVVVAGECLAVIAAQHGHRAMTIWNAPGNRALAEVRRDMHTLIPGDLLEIPAREAGQIPVRTGRGYTLQLHTVPVVFRIRLSVAGRTVGLSPYLLTLDDESTLDGSTDADGMLEAYVSPLVRAGTLRVLCSAPAPELIIPLRFGALTAVENLEGFSGRLRNLGYLAADGSDIDAVRAACQRFQEKQGLAIAWPADAATLDRLFAMHDQQRPN